MSSNVGLQLDEIAKCSVAQDNVSLSAWCETILSTKASRTLRSLNDLDRMREQKRTTEKCIADLEKDRDGLHQRIEEMRRRKDELEDRLRVEQERLQRQERSISQGEATYAKLMDSSQSLVDFMKKEYHDTRRQ
ncbi:hypothetical protein Q1695_006542 [Nippostrongylus brasiliensis]|nr:hypothetical protein Q1695_006542 [Nippostrongylus brasiliensis]